MVSETAYLRLVPESSLDEGELVTRARDGDRAALDALIGRYVRDVFDLAARILGNRDLAQDAAQDAFVNALGGFARFRGESSFRTWLLRITANAARSLGRRRSRRRETPLSAAEELPAPGAEAAFRTLFRSEAERVAHALERLPPKQRMAVTLRIYQGLSYREVAQVARCTEGSARVNYHLGIKRLKELLT